MSGARMEPLAVRAARAVWVACGRPDAADMPGFIRAVCELVDENNALRKNNERLTLENARLREAAERRERDLITATTMGEHYRVLAENRAQRLEAARNDP